jgi:hypothetical protein
MHVRPNFGSDVTLLQRRGGGNDDLYFLLRLSYTVLSYIILLLRLSIYLFQYIQDCILNLHFVVRVQFETHWNICVFACASIGVRGVD